jgi:hypothetical protein
MNRPDTSHARGQGDRPQKTQQFQRQRQQMRQQQQTHHNQSKTRIRTENLVHKREDQPILTGLPHVHFLKETQGHQHVHHADVVIAVPEGRRCLLWFTSTSSSLTSGAEKSESMNRCVLIELSEANRMGKRYPIKTCFHSSLAYGNGTVVMGTLSRIANLKTVAVHNIYSYKGTPYNNTNYLDKLRLFDSLFQHEIRQLSYFPDQVVIGLPLMAPGDISHDELLTHLRSTPYQVAAAQYRYNNRKDNSVVNVPMSNMMITPIEKTTEKEAASPVKYIDYRAIRSGRIRVSDAVFSVTPDLQNDVYRLGTSAGYHGFAAIQSYETSKFMNKLFRNIKENRNLDLLEESDDEDDFENVAEDKYVYMDKTFRLLCRYLHKINKWEPYKIADRGRQIVNATEVSGVGRDTETHT